MAEGGMFPWKMQKIWSRGPTANYSGLRDPLPKPPAGMIWHQDKDTKEWKLVKEEEEESQQQEKEKEKLDVFSASDKEPELAEEPELDRDIMVDTLPPLPPTVELHPQQLHNYYNEDDWELLSDRVSCSSHGGTIFVSRAGSVRSISSIDGDPNCTGSGSLNTTLSVPFKIQRTHSSSTLDSTDNALGPSGVGVLGVDYVEHVILPTDTLQGICLAYKINSTRLRQANHFSGNSLLLAPKKLVIPLSKKALRSGFIRVQDTDAKEYKLHAFLAEFSDLSLTEAKA
jgi:ligand-binding SRPBCC domain-containing protein